MRWIRPIVLVLFLATLAAYIGMRVYDEAYLDHTAPVITSKKDTIEVSVHATKQKLIKGLKAEDNRDGDLTDGIEVESIGPILSDGSREIHYVVCDHSNNVGSYTRSLRYKDYRSPRIYLEKALVFPEGKVITLLENMKADDVLDGDITSKIQCINTSLYLQNPSAGTYDMTFQVANSAGDSMELGFPVKVLTAEEQAGLPQIILDGYTAYVEKGESFDPFRYVKEVSLNGRTLPVNEESDHEWAYEDYRVKGLVSGRNYISSEHNPSVLFYNDIIFRGDVNTSQAGVYTVTYRIVTEDGVEGESTLNVVVE